MATDIVLNALNDYERKLIAAANNRILDIVDKHNNSLGGSMGGTYHTKFVDYNAINFSEKNEILGLLKHLQRRMQEDIDAIEAVKEEKKKYIASKVKPLEMLGQ